MNGKQRLIAALQHHEPDRVPVGEMGIDYPVIEQVLGHETFYRAKAKERQAIWAGRRDEVVRSQKQDLVALVKALEWDLAPVWLTYSDKTDYAPARVIDGRTWEDAAGNLWKTTEDLGDAVCVQPRAITRADLEQLLHEPLVVDESELELVRYVVRELGETHFIVGRGWHSPASWTDGTFVAPGEGLTMRMDEFLLMTIEEPETVHGLLEAHSKRAIEYGRALIQAGVDAVLVNADYCHNTGPWMSPAAFREYVLPRLKAHAEAFHAAGAWVIKHTDGLSWELLDMMIEAGIDALHGIQPDIGMDLKVLKEKYGHRLGLFGAVNCDTLVRGTPAAVEREVLDCLRYAAPGGGFVLTSSNSIQAGARYENYMAMLRAVRAHGGYPLQVPGNGRVS
jgi:uroporphyrinogen decarboxylase